MKVLESFMIGLGLKVDEKSFRGGQRAFDELTNSALQFGAVLAGKLGLQKVVTDFADAGTKLENFNKLTGVSVENVQKLDYALRKQGGAAGDAFNSIKNIQNLMASPLTGNVGWMGEAAKFGFDPNILLNAKSTEDAVDGIADSFEKMNTIHRQGVGHALGLTESEVRLYSLGSEKLREYRKEAEGIGILNKTQTGQAKELNQAMSDFDATISSIANRMGSDLTPAVTELVTEFVDFYKANKDWIDLDIDKAMGAIADNLKLIAAAMALLGAGGVLKGFAVLRGIAGLAGAGRAGAAAAGVAGAGASGLAIAGGGLAALTYSGSLNDGEDEMLRKRRQGEDATPMAPKIIDYFVKKGWSREQAAGIVANLQQESNFDTGAVGDGGKAYGVAQWHGDRQAEFRKWSGKDIRGSTLEDQLGFVHYEMTQGREKAAGDRLRGATSAEDAGAIVSRYYERPKNADDEANFRGDRAASYGSGGIQDNRSYTFHGADEGKIRKILREEVGDMANQTIEDIKSSEK